MKLSNDPIIRRREVANERYFIETQNTKPNFAPAIYYRMIETIDIEGIGGIFAPNASLHFGEVQLSGRQQIVQGYREFLGSMESYSIEVVNIWRMADEIIVAEAVVRDNNKGETRMFQVPMVSVFEMNGNLIQSQRDYFDPSPMMPAAQQCDSGDAIGAPDL